MNNYAAILNIFLGIHTLQITFTGDWSVQESLDGYIAPDQSDETPFYCSRQWCFSRTCQTISRFLQVPRATRSPKRLCWTFSLRAAHVAEASGRNARSPRMLYFHTFVHLEESEEDGCAASGTANSSRSCIGSRHLTEICLPACIFLSYR